MNTSPGNTYSAAKLTRRDRFQHKPILTGMASLALLAAADTQTSMAQRPVGIDVSSIQGDPNWSSIKSAGISFAWAQATEGTGIINSDFPYNESNGKAAGVLMGAYHFAYPDLNGPTAEAAYFWAEASPYVVADGKSLMPMLDMEVFSGLVGASTYSQWVNDWCNAIVGDAATAGNNVTPVIYVSSCNACEFDSSISGWYSWLANYNGENPQTGGPWNICGNCDVWGSGVWEMWQYSSTGSVSGISGAVDLDVMGGNYLSALTVTTTGNPHINPAVARTSDGRLEQFAIGKTGQLYTDYQTSGGWSGWQAMGTSGNTWAQNALPAVGVNSDGRLEVFIVGTDGSVNHNYQKVAGSSASTNWSGFSILSSSHVNQTVKLAVGSWANGKLDVFVVGTDGALYHNNQTSSGWSGFASLGGTWSQNDDIAVMSDKNGELDVLMVGSTGNLYNNWQTASNSTSWHGWNDLGGSLSETTRLALGRNTDGRLEVVTIGTDGVAYHDWETAANGQTSWNGWASLGGSWELDSKPLVAADQNGALEVFLIGNTGNMYHNYQTGGTWSGWVNLNGSFTQNVRPCVGQNQSGTLELFLTGKGSDMQHNYESSANSTTWAGWSSLGGSWN
jgi:GH25 family lysozyme M1 (1,4-beta-N-acetylmuramidase)